MDDEKLREALRAEEEAARAGIQRAKKKRMLLTSLDDFVLKITNARKHDHIGRMRAVRNIRKRLNLDP